MRIHLIACLALFAAACGAPQNSEEPAAPAAGVSVEAAWAAPTPGGVDVSAGYLVIRNTSGSSDALVAASSPRAGRVEVHEMTMDGAVMRMRATPRLEIPAGGEVTLAPGGLHLMFYEVAPPFSVGDEIPVELTFENAGAVGVNLSVRPPGASHQSH